MNSDQIIYKLVVEDVQTVAEEEIKRNLTDDEINSIIDLIAEKIPWYDAIASAIRQEIHD